MVCEHCVSDAQVAMAISNDSHLRKAAKISMIADFGAHLIAGIGRETIDEIINSESK